MEKVFDMVTGFFSKMTALFMGLLSFGIIAEILFGKACLGMSVIDNVMGLIAMFGKDFTLNLTTVWV